MSSNEPTVTSVDATNFPAPSGTKVATNKDTITSKQKYPIVQYESFYYWPLSYVDNRESFAIVVTKGSVSSPNVINTFEATGGRYIQSISVYSNNDTVAFIGQQNVGPSVSWSQLAAEGSSGNSNSATSAAPTTLSTSTTSNTLTSSTSTSTSTPAASSSSSSSSVLHGGAIAGIAIGSIAGAIIFIILARWLYKNNPTTRRLLSFGIPPTIQDEAAIKKRDELYQDILERKRAQEKAAKRKDSIEAAESASQLQKKSTVVGSEEVSRGTRGGSVMTGGLGGSLVIPADSTVLSGGTNPTEAAPRPF